VGRYARQRMEVASSDQEDPDSDPGGGHDAEDDTVILHVVPPGIWVNTELETLNDDGLCNIVEAFYAAEFDNAPSSRPGDCTDGSGADTIHLQPGAKYISTRVWSSGDAFPSINSTITIEGNGARIERGITPTYFRALQVSGGGVLTLRNLGMHYFETRDGTCGGAINVLFGSLVLDNVFLSQNRVRDGFSGGGAICNMSGTLTATNSRIEDNTVDVSESFLQARGGGITTSGGSALTTLTNTSVRNNVVTSGAFASGGGVEVRHGGELKLNGGSVRENRIQLTGLTSQAYGGGISAEGDDEPAEVRIDGTTISENRVDAVGDNRTALGGGISLRFASASLIDAVVGDADDTFGNQAPGGGGGIFVARDADIGISRGSVSGNIASAGQGGGGILSDGGLVDLRNVELAGNRTGGTSSSGGAIKTWGRLVVVGGTIRANAAIAGGGIDQQDGGLEIDGVTLSGNSATVGGGALRIGGIFAPAALIENSTISENTAGGLGGGILTGRETTLVNTDVTGNRLGSTAGCGTEPACPAGGGIFATDDLYINDSEVSSNNALVSGATGSSGGGIWSENGLVFLTRSRVAQNAARYGGGVHAREGHFEALDSTLELNNAVYGGAVNLLSSNASVERSTIDGNRATQWGGGIVMNETSLGLWNATVSRNVSENLAGAIYHGSNSVLTVFSSTITGNGALRTGGIFSYKPDGGQIIASIVAGNQSYEAGDPDCDADSGSPPPSGGWNLFARGGGCELRADLGDREVLGDTVATEVVFPLADNGGATLTHALRPSSPALDAAAAGVCGPEDQRRLTRPKDGDGDGDPRCDSGAVEQQTPLLAPLTITSISPNVKPSGGAPPLIEVRGTGFSPLSTARLDGQLRGAVEYFAPSMVLVHLPLADGQTSADFVTKLLTVARPGGGVSNAASFTVVGPKVSSAESAAVAPGSSGNASVYSSTGSVPSVSGTLTNNGGGSAALTVARYNGNPSGTAFETFEGGGYVDVQVTGADSSDRLEAKFYWPSTLTNQQENELRLKYLNVARDPDRWELVKSSGGASPAKNKANNLDGTTSGGRFTVTFSNTSTPKITELSGTVLATDLDQVSPVTTASVTPAGGSNGWHTANPTVTFDATDDSGVARTEWALGNAAFETYGGPFDVTTEGVNALRYRSVDEAGNEETERTLEVKLDKSLPTASVTPLASETSSTTLGIAWSGSDAVSGIASYDLYASVDGGPLARWKSGTTETSADYVGEAGRIYGFAAIATDGAGNTEALPIAPETTIRIVAQPAPPPPPPPPAPKPKPKPKAKPKPKKVTLCHKRRTIKVPKSQVKKHRKHGDKLGACKKPKRKPKR
jgi:hypothetical protein